jgi:hypothetical protein
LGSFQVKHLEPAALPSYATTPRIFVFSQLL